jgi:YNFM family putative membrane transporter
MQLQRGTRAFRELTVAAFAAGFSIFSLLYAAQALLPALAAEFRVSPATSSLAVSFATAAVALSIAVSGFVVDALERRSLILAAMTASAALTLLTAATHSWPLLLACRALMGLALGLLPSALIAYLAEEVEGRSLGFATGVYIAGSVFGGMAGRLLAGLLVDVYSWQAAFAVLGSMGLLGALYSAHALPRSRHFVKRRLPLPESARSYLVPLRDPGLPWIYLAGALQMGGFITVYNYVAFRLLQPPYALRQATVSLMFALYLLGMVSSSLAGSLTSRFGRRHLYWPLVALTLCGVACTMASPLWMIVLGVAIMTFGFFGSHSVATSWVSVRGMTNRTQSAAWYVFGFYVGSSVAGWIGGYAWSAYGWNGVGVMVLLLVSAAFLIALRLARLPPLPRTPHEVNALRAAN